MSTHSSEQQDKLRAFGLSEYSVRAYLALLELNETEARDVSRLAKVPLAKVYAVLDGLAAKGLCAVFPGSPKRYAPVPIEDYVSRLVTEQRRSADALLAQLEELVRLFPVAEGTRLSDRGRIQALRGRRSVVEHESRLLASAKGELVMICSPGRVRRLRNLLPELESARERGVHIRLMIPDGLDAAKDVQLFSAFAQVRLRAGDEQPRASGVSFVSNGVSALIADHIPDDESHSAGNDVGVQTGNEGLVAAIHDLLARAWESAPPQAPVRGVTQR